MRQRRFFLKNGFGGACAVLLSSGAFAPFAKKRAEPTITTLSDDGKPYAVKIVYTFESEPLRELLLPKIEKTSLIEAINQKYQQSGQILSFTFRGYEQQATNSYVFNSERSYLEWEAEMILAKVMDQKYCGTVVVHREDLSKLMLIEVKSPDKVTT